MPSPRDFMQRISVDRIPVLANTAGDPRVTLTPHDYFLVSRIDGHTTVRTLRQMTGMGEAAFEEAFTRALAAGLCRLPGASRDDALEALGLGEGSGSYKAITVTPDRGGRSGAHAAVRADGGEPARSSTSGGISGSGEQQRLRGNATSGEQPRVRGAETSGPQPRLGGGAVSGEHRRVFAPAPAPNSAPAGAATAAAVQGGAAATTAAAQPGPSAMPSAPPTGDAEGDDDASSSFGVGERYAPLRTESGTARVVQAPKLGQDLIPTGWPVPFSRFVFDPVAMATGTALDTEQKQVALYYHYHLQRVTYYALLGIEQGASRRDVKLAYFNLSKAFHPDRWYRKETGEFSELIEDVFKWLSRAYGVLSSPTKRKGYDKLLSRGYVGEWQLEPPTPQSRRPHPPQREVGAAPQSQPVRAPEERASAGGVRRTLEALAMRARQAENMGDWVGAADLYQRALLVAPSLDLRIRLVECMLKGAMDPVEIDQQLSSARADGADEKTSLVFEAEVARRLGDVERAVVAYRGVLALEPENPVARLGLERLEGHSEGAQ